jgi:hypothetical protein
MITASARLTPLPIEERGITIADFLLPIRVGERMGSRLRNVALIGVGALLIFLTSRVAIPIPGSPDHASIARSMKSSSRRRIVSTPTASFRWKTRPARIDSTIAGVPPSSRCSGSSRYTCSSGLTYATVPPPGACGTRFANSSRRATRTPGVPGPPMNLWGLTTIASL